MAQALIVYEESDRGVMSVRRTTKRDNKGRTMCFFYLYSDAAGTIPALFGSKLTRNVIIAVPKKIESSNINSIAAVGLSKKIEALFHEHGRASPPDMAPGSPLTQVPVAPLWCVTFVFPHFHSSFSLCIIIASFFI